MTFDYISVGAGYTVSVPAERLVRKANNTVLVIDRCNHVVDNAHDHYSEAGILVHKCGPHSFHTNSRENSNGSSQQIKRNLI